MVPPADDADASNVLGRKLVLPVAQVTTTTGVTKETRVDVVAKVFNHAKRVVTGVRGAGTLPNLVHPDKHVTTFNVLSDVIKTPLGVTINARPKDALLKKLPAKVFLVVKRTSSDTRVELVDNKLRWYKVHGVDKKEGDGAGGDGPAEPSG